MEMVTSKTGRAPMKMRKVGERKLVIGENLQKKSMRRKVKGKGKITG